MTTMMGLAITMRADVAGRGLASRPSMRCIQGRAAKDDRPMRAREVIGFGEVEPRGVKWMGGWGISPEGAG